MENLTLSLNQDTSCINFSLSSTIDDTSLINCIGQALILIPFKEVVVRVDAIQDSLLMKNALLFVDIIKMPYGEPLQCSISSAKLSSLIPEWGGFLKEMARLTSLEVFIDSTDKKGYLFKPTGEVTITRFVTEFYDGFECMFLHNEDRL